LTLDEAQVSIALAAVSGGMFEIGDDLPTLGASPERLSLVKNLDLLDVAKLGRASIPIDLMTYAPGDQQPSVFLLKESGRQAMLTVFNWTEKPRTRVINLAQLGLKESSSYKVVEVFGDQGCCNFSSGEASLNLKPHSVRMIKFVDNSVPATPLSLDVQSPGGGAAGETLTFKARAESLEAPVLAFQWDFGDGTTGDGTKVNHAYTRAGEYQVTVTAIGLDSVTNRKIVAVTISGEISTRFVPSKNRRAE
jgi:hypothetical protein